MTFMLCMGLYMHHHACMAPALACHFLLTYSLPFMCAYSLPYTHATYRILRPTSRVLSHMPISHANTHVVEIDSRSYVPVAGRYQALRDDTLGLTS